MPDTPTIKELLEAGAHFGHQTSRWHPRMKRYIFTKRNGIHIVDLEQTYDMSDIGHTKIDDTLKLIEGVGEKKEVTKEAKKAIVEVSNGDCRRIENILQSAAAILGQHWQGQEKHEHASMML